MSEAREQAAYVKWLRAKYPQYAHCLRVSQSGAARGSGRQGAIRMAIVKAQGAEPGESDMLFALPRGQYHCLVIEHKKANGLHKLTETQQAYLDRHRATGALAISTRGLGALQAATEAYIEGGEWTTVTN